MESSPVVEASALMRLANMIYAHSGLNYCDSLGTLESKWMRRLQQLGLPGDRYLELLQSQPAEWKQLMQHVTINETYFFREEGQLEELVRLVAGYPEHGGIRIWSSACSTGEEPYTIAMMLESSGIPQAGNVEIVASDINQRVLEYASQARYPKSSLCFRRTTGEQLRRYFTYDGECYHVKPALRNRVSFRNINLVDGHQMDSIGGVDIIFCRNVLIYFDADTVERVIERFHRLLRPGGYLFLGHAETARGCSGLFDIVKGNGVFYYKKKGG